MRTRRLARCALAFGSPRESVRDAAPHELGSRFVATCLQKQHHRHNIAGNLAWTGSSARGPGDAALTHGGPLRTIA